MPAYEVSQQTLDLLIQLKQANERQDKYNQLIMHDMQLKADEYRVEGINILLLLLLLLLYIYMCVINNVYKLERYFIIFYYFFC